jgi:hypothetical protein
MATLDRRCPIWFDPIRRRGNLFVWESDAMPTSIACVSCGARLSLPDRLPEHIKSLKCPRCKKSFPLAELEPPMPEGEDSSPESFPNLEIGREPGPGDTREDLPPLQGLGEVETLEEVEDDDVVEDFEEVEDDIDDVEVVEDEDIPEVVAADDEADRSRKRGLLEHRSFFIRPEVGSIFTASYLILNSRSEKELGRVKDERDAGSRLAAIATLGIAGCKTLVIRDRRGDAVGLLRAPPHVLKQRVELFDADERLLFCFEPKILTTMGRLTVYDHKDGQFAEVKGNSSEQIFYCDTRAGKHLGKMCRESVKTGASAMRVMTTGRRWYVEVDRSQAGKPDMTLLMLGAALAFDLAYYEAAPCDT